MSLTMTFRYLRYLCITLQKILDACQGGEIWVISKRKRGFDWGFDSCSTTTMRNFHLVTCVSKTQAEAISFMFDFQHGSMIDRTTKMHTGYSEASMARYIVICHSRT